MSSHLEPLLPTPLAPRRMWLVLLGFTAALCWWVGIVGVLVSGGGAQALQMFLAVPVLVTVGTALAVLPPSHRGAKHISRPHRLKARRGRSATGSSSVILCGFTAALCWWIAVIAVLNTGGGAHVFLAIPVLATVLTFLASRKRRPLFDPARNTP